jgi:hypothetical protein
MVASASIDARRIYKWTLFAWALGVILHFTWHLLRIFNGPPSSEVYANTIGFQLAAYALTQLPYWLLGLIGVLVIEFVLFGRRGQPPM